jgi:hypothetical protein
MKRSHDLPKLWCGGALAALALATGVVGCRDATEITLHVHTNMPCSADDAWHGVAVYVGDPGKDVETTSPTLVTRTCDQQGNVGSLVVVPSSSKSAAIGLRVVAGIEHKPEECQDAGYKGCIVARRALRFTPHDGLDVDVELASDCVSKPCDSEHTCEVGQCLTTDPQKAAPPLPLDEPSVRCGDNEARCATSGDVCCLSVDVEHETTSGVCKPSAECPPTSTVLFCDDDSDCPDDDAAGLKGVCWLSYWPVRDAPFIPNTIAQSSCTYDRQSFTGTGVGLVMCQTRQGCLDGANICRSSDDPNGAVNRLPGYFWCPISNLPP